MSTKHGATSSSAPVVSKASRTSTDAPSQTNVSSTPASNATTSALPNEVAPPPVVATPTPPLGFIAPTMSRYRGYHPKTLQLIAAAGAISDLGKFTDYLTVFGTSAPAASAVATALETGLAWRALRDSSESWNTYVKALDAMAWQAALLLLDELKPLFLIAVAKNAALSSAYPGLARIFDATVTLAKASAATKKKKAKAEVEQLKATANATAAATKAATTEAPVTTKAVTVNA